MECNICSKKTKHLENHHIIPKSRGGTNNKNNMIKLCSECHGLAHDVSFANERGGLIKEAVTKTRANLDLDKEWLHNNEDFVNKKMTDLYNRDEDTHMLMLLLMERGNFSTSNIKEWCEVGKVRFKTTFTFK